MLEAIPFRSIRYDGLAGNSPSNWSLDDQGSDCLLSAALLVGLCRSQGIPARLIKGHFLTRLYPANHGWVEIWIDGMGWLPLDVLNQHRSRPEWRADHQWWDQFVRRWDYRMVFECLPLAFTGPMSVRFPSAWQMLHTPVPGGLDIIYSDISDGSLIYRDHIVVDWTV